MAIGTWIIHGPIARKRAAIAIDDSRVIGIAENVGVTQPGPHPLRFLIPVRRQRKISVLDRGILFERLLRVKHAPSGEDRHETKGESDPKTHERHWADRRAAISEYHAPNSAAFRRQCLH